MKVYHDKSFKDITTFNIGGPIKNLYYPETKKELILLCELLKNPPIIGVGSKILASNKTFENVICTTRLNKIQFNENVLIAESGAYVYDIVHECVKRGLIGTEFLIDIPATIGGAAIMNAGFLGHDMSRIVSKVEYISEGELKETTDIKWKRRWSSLQEIGIITEVTLNLKHGDKTLIKNRVQKYHEARAHQPQGVASAGGIFINHRTLSFLLEKLPYLKRGDAEIVKNCPNFIVNHGNATYEEVLHLINLIEHHAKLLGFSMIREVKIIDKNE